MSAIVYPNGFAHLIDDDDPTPAEGMRIEFTRTDQAKMLEATLPGTPPTPREVEVALAQALGCLTRVQAERDALQARVQELEATTARLTLAVGNAAAAFGQFALGDWQGQTEATRRAVAREIARELGEALGIPWPEDADRG